MDMINKIILVCNLVIYRLDSLLYNFVDSILIIAFSIVVFKLLGSFTGYNNFPLSLVMLPMVLHISYMISYVINDTIDYGSASTTKKIDSLFYDLRPIYYFKRSKNIVIYTVLLYVSLLILIFVFYPSLLPLTSIFAIVIALLSFLHSMHQGSTRARVITFGLMRLVKYTCLLFLLNSITFGYYFQSSLFWIFTSLIFPYTMYSLQGYLKNLNPNIPRAITLLIALIPFSAGLIGVTITSGFPLDLIKIITTGYLLIILPAFCISKLCLKMTKSIFRAKRPYYTHLGHLSFTTIFLLIEVIAVLNLLQMIHD